MFQRVVCVRLDGSRNSRHCEIWLVLSLCCLWVPATASAAFNWSYHMMCVCLSFKSCVKSRALGSGLMPEKCLRHECDKIFLSRHKLLYIAGIHD